MCSREDDLKFCVSCSGNCTTKSEIAAERCKSNHYVYLTYFPGVVKVGVAIDRRKYLRLIEQGAIYAYIIAKASSGKEARQIESAIKKQGVKSMVNSSYKMNNLRYTEKAVAKQALEDVLDKIKTGKLLENPEFFANESAINILKQLEDVKSNGQQSLFGESPVMKKVKDINILKENIIGFIGTIAVFQKSNKFCAFNMKEFFGYEIYLS